MTWTLKPGEPADASQLALMLCVVAGSFFAKASPVRAVTVQRFVDHMLTETVPSRDRLLGVTRAAPPE